LQRHELHERKEYTMTIEIGNVEALLRQHWHIPKDLSAEALQHIAFRLQVMAGQKYSQANLKNQLCMMQARELKQDPDDPACDQIASLLLGNSCT
jgi:hypothetical protein